MHHRCPRPKDHRARHRTTCGSLPAALDVHPHVAMQILRDSKIVVTVEIWVQVPSAATRHSRRAPQAERSACLMVAAVCCCRKIRNGRSMIWNRPPRWVGDTGIEPVTSSV